MPSFVRPNRQWPRVLAFVERPTSNYKEQCIFICYKSLRILQIYFIFNLIIITEKFINAAWIWNGCPFSVVFLFSYFPFLSRSWFSTVEASWNLEHEIIFTHLTVLAAAINPLERSPAWFDNALALQSDAAAAMAAFRSVGAAEVFCLFVRLNGPITSGGPSARLVESVGAVAHSFSCMHRFALPPAQQGPDLFHQPGILRARRHGTLFFYSWNGPNQAPVYLAYLRRNVWRIFRITTEPDCPFHGVLREPDRPIMTITASFSHGTTASLRDNRGCVLIFDPRGSAIPGKGLAYASLAHVLINEVALALTLFTVPSLGVRLAAPFARCRPGPSDAAS